jgi:hypothetical protein
MFVGFISTGMAVGTWFFMGSPDLAKHASDEAGLAQAVRSLTADLQDLRRIVDATEALGVSFARTTNELKLLGQRLARLEEKQAALGSRLEGVDPSSDVEATAGSDDISANDSSEYLRQSVGTQIEVLDQAVRSQRTDPAWKTSSEQVLQDVFDAWSGEGLHLVATECRATLCRIEMFVAGEGFPPDMVQDLIDDVPWNAPSFFRMTNNGDGLLYLAREGYGLP